MCCRRKTPLLSILGKVCYMYSWHSAPPVFLFRKRENILICVVALIFDHSPLLFIDLWHAPVGLETVTRGAVLATSHRVVSPPVGSPTRYSIPFFQVISQEIHLGQMVIDSELLPPRFPPRGQPLNLMVMMMPSSRTYTSTQRDSWGAGRD